LSLLIVSLLWLISEVSLSIMKRAPGASKDSDKSSLRLLWIIIVGSISLGVYLGISGKGIALLSPGGASAAGLILICSGLALRWISIFQLKKYFTVNVAILQDHQLVQDGLYRHIRHPAYAGSLLSFFGLGLAFNNLSSLLAILIPIAISFLYRISVEDAALGESFGAEYEEYRKRTKRLIPWVY